SRICRRRPCGHWSHPCAWSRPSRSVSISPPTDHPELQIGPGLSRRNVPPASQEIAMRPSICVAALLLLLTTAGAVAQRPAGSGAPIARSTVPLPSIGAGQYVEKAVIADMFQIETSMVALVRG